MHHSLAFGSNGEVGLLRMAEGTTSPFPVERLTHHRKQISLTEKEQRSWI